MLVVWGFNSVSPGVKPLVGGHVPEMKSELSRALLSHTN